MYANSRVGTCDQDVVRAHADMLQVNESSRLALHHELSRMAHAPRDTLCRQWQTHCHHFSHEDPHLNCTRFHDCGKIMCFIHQNMHQSILVPEVLKVVVDHCAPLQHHPGYGYNRKKWHH